MARYNPQRQPTNSSADTPLHSLTSGYPTSQLSSQTKGTFSPPQSPNSSSHLRSQLLSKTKVAHLTSPFSSPKNVVYPISQSPSPNHIYSTSQIHSRTRGTVEIPQKLSPTKIAFPNSELSSLYMGQFETSKSPSRAKGTFSPSQSPSRTGGTVEIPQKFSRTKVPYPKSQIRGISKFTYGASQVATPSSITYGKQQSSITTQSTYQVSSPSRESSFAWGSGNPSSTTTTDVISYNTPYHKKHSTNYYKLLERRKTLPIWSYKDKILHQIMESQVIIIEGETGSGKSTQVPHWCLELPGLKQVVCTQPRKIAAISLAQRVAQEMDVRVGEEVGFIVRFERKVSDKTVLKYVTDGLLLRQSMQDNALTSYDVIIIDEVHERKMVTDILLGVLKNILPLRTDLKVIIMSATLNADKFREFFDDCPHLRIPGKSHPVDTYFSPQVFPRAITNPSRKEDKYIAEFVYYAINVVLDICEKSKSEGDILVFVTGREEIDFICRNLEHWIDILGLKGSIDVIPLYGDLPYNSQQKIFGPSPKSTIGKIGRKCIVSTNIAETSITIDGVVFVIDSGKVKLSSVVGNGHMKSLLPVDISQSSAEQRTGRAGRTRPGICYRLYSKGQFDLMAKDTMPEILRCDISDVILQLKAMRIDIEDFQSLDQPSPEALESAMYNLKLLGALDINGDITPIGIQMSLFPIDPEVSRMLVASNEYSCQEEVMTLAGMLSGDRPGSVFIHGGKNKDRVAAIQSKFYHESGDHLTYVNVYDEFVANGGSEDWCRDNFINYKLVWEANKIRDQLFGIMIRLKLIPAYATSAKHANVMKAILTGIVGNIAQIDPLGSNFMRQKYVTVRNGHKVMFHPSCCLQPSITPPPLICYSSCIKTNPKQDYISMVSSIEQEWYDEVRANQQQALQPPILKKPESPRYCLSEMFDSLSF